MSHGKLYLDSCKRRGDEIGCMSRTLSQNVCDTKTVDASFVE